MAVRGNPMLYINSFNVKHGMQKEFQAWAKKNDDLFRKLAPPGWTYRGTHAYVWGFGRYGAAMMWEINKYGDLDAARAHTDPNYGRLMEDLDDFTSEVPGESVLLRELSDTRIMEKSTVSEARSRRTR